VYCYQPEWAYLDVQTSIPEDPLGLRDRLPSLYIGQGLIYLYLIFIKLRYYPAEIRFRFFGRKDPLIKPLFAYWYHAAIITLLIVFIKITFERDLGDYIIGTYLSIILYVSGFIVVARKLELLGKIPDEPNGRPKYEKSPLSEEKKNEILSKIIVLLEEKKYYTRNMLSLSETAKAVSEPAHHVSQVINEKLGKNFFDLLSAYRVEEAKILLRNRSNDNLTIEDIAEQVGYNSKAAFNKAFKALTGTTPSAFRRNS
jgi:AraC-like DNA-binding protein